MNMPPVSRCSPDNPERIATYQKRYATVLREHRPNASEQLLAAFLEQMKGKEYGDDPLLNAFGWFCQGSLAAASENSAHEGYNGIAHDVEQAWQMLEVCGVPRERAKNNLARGIEVLSTRLGREEHFQKAMEVDAARYRWWREKWARDTDEAMDELNDVLSKPSGVDEIDAAIDASILKGK